MIDLSAKCHSFDSKWFLQALGHEGLNNLLMAYEDKSAQAVCTFAYCGGPGAEPLLFEGRVNVGDSISSEYLAVNADSSVGYNCAGERADQFWYVSDHV